MEREELTRREAGAWAVFHDLVGSFSPEQLERPGVNAEGWSVKDVLWHVAHWWDDLTSTLEQLRAGTFAEPPEDDDETDAENAQVLEESRGMSLAEVRVGLDTARARVLAAWATLPEEVDDVAAKHFLWETTEHYEEHEPDLRRFAEELGAS